MCISFSLPEKLHLRAQRCTKFPYRRNCAQKFTYCPTSQSKPYMGVGGYTSLRFNDSQRIALDLTNTLIWGTTAVWTASKAQKKIIRQFHLDSRIRYGIQIWQSCNLMDTSTKILTRGNKQQPTPREAPRWQEGFRIMPASASSGGLLHVSCPYFYNKKQADSRQPKKQKKVLYWNELIA